MMHLNTMRSEYDEEGDILDVFFGDNQPAACVQLTDDILLRFDPETRRPVSLTLLSLAVLTQTTDLGPRSFPIANLDHLPDGWRDVIEEILTCPPVNQFLHVSVFSPSLADGQPIVQVAPFYAHSA